MSSLQVGIGKSDITPQVGTPLYGNYRQDYASRGVHDPLYARALVLDNSQTRVVLLQVDICKLGREDVATLRQTITELTAIPSSAILIAATHTHAGPPTTNCGAHAPMPPQALAELLNKAAQAVPAAINNLSPSSLAVGYAQEDRVAFNRRLKCNDGTTHMNWEKLDPAFVIEPCGTTDTQLITLSVRQGDTRRGALVNYALHPAILAGDNYLISADYPGCLSQALSQLYGDQFVTAFFNGCCGNINHIDYADLTQGRGFTMTQRVGYMLAVAACQAMNSETSVNGDTLAVSHEMVQLPRVQFSREHYDHCLDVIERAKTHPAPAQEDGLPEEYYAQLHVKLYEKQHEDDKLEVQVMRVGDTAIVGVPGELFCEFSMHIRQHSIARHTIVIEQANDAAGYFPTQASFEQGGYEVIPGSTNYQPGAGEALAQSAINQVAQLFQ